MTASRWTWLDAILFAAYGVTVLALSGGERAMVMSGVAFLACAIGIFPAALRSTALVFSAITGIFLLSQYGSQGVYADWVVIGGAFLIFLVAVFGLLGRSKPEAC